MLAEKFWKSAQPIGFWRVESKNRQHVEKCRRPMIKSWKKAFFDLLFQLSTGRAVVEKSSCLGKNEKKWNLRFFPLIKPVFPPFFQHLFGWFSTCFQSLKDLEKPDFNRVLRVFHRFRRPYYCYYYLIYQSFFLSIRTRCGGSEGTQLYIRSVCPKKVLHNGLAHTPVRPYKERITDK